VTCPDDLLGVLNLLSSHGLAPIDIRIDRHHPAEQQTSPADRG
jgi:hypothetical protein